MICVYLQYNSPEMHQVPVSLNKSTQFYFARCKPYKIIEEEGLQNIAFASNCQHFHGVLRSVKTLTSGAGTVGHVGRPIIVSVVHVVVTVLTAMRVSAAPKVPVGRHDLRHLAGAPAGTQEKKIDQLRINRVAKFKMYSKEDKKQSPSKIS